MNKLELYILDVIQGKKKGLFAFFVKCFCLFLSLFFWLAVKVRNKAYDLKIFTKYRPPVPLIISVGNIVAGGTGKTPATILIAEQFNNEFKVAILSRGYRSPSEKQSFPTFLSNGEGPLHSASYCGDEPYLISEALPKAIVVVGRDRHQSSDLAAKAGAQLIILDDGMQHRQLARDLEVVVMDASDPFGRGYFLPYGLLREELTALSRAHLVLLNHIESDEQFAKVKTQILAYSKAPVVGCLLSVIHVYDLLGNEVVLEGKKVGVFCAIAKPDKFKETVLSQKADILAEFFLADHLAFSPSMLQEFANHCKLNGVEMLVCTEKDRVKFPKYFETLLPIAWLKVSLLPVYGLDEWKSFIQNAKKDIIRQI